MPSITLKNIPEPLFEQLKTAAASHRRSLNSEILWCLERTIGSSRVDVRERIERARALREKTAHYRVDDEELNEARRSGRP
jgi:plasmid stability protein